MREHVQYRAWCPSHWMQLGTFGDVATRMKQDSSSLRRHTGIRVMLPQQINGARNRKDADHAADDHGNGRAGVLRDIACDQAADRDHSAENQRIDTHHAATHVVGRIQLDRGIDQGGEDN